MMLRAAIRAQRAVLSTKKRNMASLIIHPEVQEALSSGTPVVALESTIISHGM